MLAIYYISHGLSSMCCNMRHTYLTSEHNGDPEATAPTEEIEVSLHDGSHDSDTIAGVQVGEKVE